MALFFIILFLFRYTIIFAASPDYRFIHNDHDTLIIGEVMEMDDNFMIIRAEKHIVSSSSIDDSREQLTPQVATVNVITGNWFDDKSVGDYVIASLNKNGDMFDVAWGIYLVDSLDYKTLEVITFSPDISAVFTDFVNSDGIYTTFSFYENSVIRYYQGESTVIYNGQQSTSIPEGLDSQILQDEQSDLSSEVQNQPIFQSLNLPDHQEILNQSIADDPKAFENSRLFIAFGLGVSLVLIGIMYLTKKKKAKCRS